jgi:site-specific DNA-methyltransferase (adenine-specific)/adenine-specific DNA-methyltransferase
MPTLDWIGKQAVVNHHKQVPFHLLKQNAVYSVGEPNSGNLLIEGDNLLALKALLPYYAGQMKCIYIDPPYNTGNENWEDKTFLPLLFGKSGHLLSHDCHWVQHTTILWFMPKTLRRQRNLLTEHLYLLNEEANIRIQTMILAGLGLQGI